MDEYQKPFSMGYVLRTTAKNMRKSIDISIRKTYERLPEFINDESRSKELFMTLGYLHDMRKILDVYQEQNSEKFKGR